MSDVEVIATLAAVLAADGRRSAAGAVAMAREILDEVRRQEPELREAHERQQMRRAWRDSWQRQ